MTKELDLVTVVTNKLKDFREKGAQVADAIQALEISRGQLAKAQSDLSEYIAEVNNLATEITTELSSAGVETEAVADSLSTDESQVDETLEEDFKASKTAVSDESTVTKKKSTKPVTPEISSDDDSDESAEEDENFEHTTVEENKKPHVGLWDDDDDETF